LDIGLKENVFEIEHSFIICNPGLLNSSFQIDYDWCSAIEEIDNNKNTVSVKEIKEMLTTPKRKLDIFFTGDLLTPEKRFKSKTVCTTPEAHLEALPKNSKNVYTLKIRSMVI